MLLKQTKLSSDNVFAGPAMLFKCSLAVGVSRWKNRSVLNFQPEEQTCWLKFCPEVSLHSALTFKKSQHVWNAPWGWRPASFEASAPCCAVFFSAIAAGFLLGVILLALATINDAHLQNTFLTLTTDLKGIKSYDPYSPKHYYDTLECAH